MFREERCYITHSGRGRRCVVWGRGLLSLDFVIISFKFRFGNNGEIDVYITHSGLGRKCVIWGVLNK